MNRRDQILSDMHRTLRARRRRALAARAAGVAVPVPALVVVLLMIRGAAPPVEPGAVTPAYEHLRVTYIEPAGRVETVSDDELIELLGRAGRQAGYVRTPDRFVLTGEPAPANDRPDAATLRP